MTLLLDTRVVHWWSIDASERFSPTAQAAIEQADELAVSAISWFELAWLAHHGRIVVYESADLRARCPSADSRLARRSGAAGSDHRDYSSDRRH